MPRKQIDKPEKARDIARASLGLFALKGYAATGVEQIAEVSGIGKSTVYEYFASKEEIFVTAISEWILETMDRLSESMREINDPETRFVAFFKMIREFFHLKDPETVKLFIEIDQQTFKEGGAFFKRRHIIREMRSKFCRLIEDILLDGVSQRTFKAEIARDAPKIAINLMAYLDGIGMHYLINGDRTEFEELVNYYIERFVGELRVQL